MTIKRLTLALLSLPALYFCAGCEPPPPKTTPRVRITSPVANMPLPKGKRVEVSFTISGVDPETEPGADGKKPRFRLGEGIGRQPGVGQLVAFMDSANVQARTTKESEPLLVPSPFGGDSPDQIVVPGLRKISLFLRYNDDSDVPMADAGEVTVNISP